MQNLWNGWMIKSQKEDSLAVPTVSCIVWIMLKIKRNRISNYLTLEFILKKDNMSKNTNEFIDKE